MPRPKPALATLLAHLGRDPGRFDGAVNPPVYRASTIVAPSLEAADDEGRRWTPGETVYGLSGTPGTEALELAVAQLEGADRAILLPSGLAAISLTLSALVHPGDRILVGDNVYFPTRRFCDLYLAERGVEVEYFDPTLGAGIAALLERPTRLVFFESPGSLTFEMLDVPAVAAAARAAGALSVMDNTWASPLNHRPLEHGVDVSLQAATKYLGGHADVLLGTVAARGELADRLRRMALAFGLCAGTEECYLTLRGLRTLATRLARQQVAALEVAQWLDGRPEVARVLYPALPSDPGHEIWARDFDGASSLFGFVLARPAERARLAAMIEGYRWFALGASFGGFESLAKVSYPERSRTATRWRAPGPTIRLHVGLEDPADLIADLEAGFSRLAGL